MLFSAFFMWQLVSYVLSMILLMDMYRFYTHLLHIPDVRAQSLYPSIKYSLRYIIVELELSNTISLPPQGTLIIKCFKETRLTDLDCTYTCMYLHQFTASCDRD